MPASRSVRAAGGPLSHALPPPLFGAGSHTLAPVAAPDTALFDTAPFDSAPSGSTESDVTEAAASDNDADDNDADDNDGDGEDDVAAAAMPSATLPSAAMTRSGSWLSAAAEAAPMRAPASAASEQPAARAISIGLAGEPVTARHRSSHSDRGPPQPRTYAESTGRSGSPGPASAALTTSMG